MPNASQTPCSSSHVIGKHPAIIMVTRQYEQTYEGELEGEGEGEGEGGLGLP